MIALPKRQPLRVPFLGSSHFTSSVADTIATTVSTVSCFFLLFLNLFQFTSDIYCHEFGYFVDLSVYGLCPARDAVYLVVCGACQQVIKPQAFKTHIGRQFCSIFKEQFQLIICSFF